MHDLIKKNIGCSFPHEVEGSQRDRREIGAVELQRGVAQIGEVASYHHHRLIGRTVEMLDDREAGRLRIAVAASTAAYERCAKSMITGTWSAISIMSRAFGRRIVTVAMVSLPTLTGRVSV